MPHTVAVVFLASSINSREWARLDRPQPGDHVLRPGPKQNRQASQALLLGSLEGPLPRRRRERSAVSREQRMAEERVTRFRRGAPPKPLRSAQQRFGIEAPILKQVDERPY